MLKLFNFEQQSEEWFKERELCMTASHAQAIGNNGKGLETYIFEMMAEYFSIATKDRFTTKDTERGNELEPIAREMYELEKGVEINSIGFIKNDEFGDYVGCSPDGLIGEEGGTEIKSPNDLNHYKMIIAEDRQKEIDSKYIWQVQMNLLITGRKWWDLIFYNPNYKESLIIFRILPDEEKQEALRSGLKIGGELIQKHLQTYQSK